MTLRLCPLCHEPIAEKTLYHPACYRERERAIDRVAKFAKRHGQEPQRLCCVCLGPREKGKRMCAACCEQRERESAARYSASAKGRMRFIRYNNSPRRKITQSEWADRNRERRLATQHRYQAKHAKSGTVLPCVTLLCPGTFVRNAHNSRRLFCDSCRVLHRTISRREAISVHAIAREARRPRPQRSAA